MSSKQAVHHRRAMHRAEYMRWYATIIGICEHIIGPILSVVRRSYVAKLFFVSGLVKLSNWDDALYLATHEYPVPWLSPFFAASIGLMIELIAPILLAIGFCARPAALAMLLLTLVSQYYYTPINAQVFWIILLGWWFVMGAGSVSCDHLLRAIGQSILPGARALNSLYRFLTIHIGPFYKLSARLWIGSVLLVAASKAEWIQQIPSMFPFLRYEYQVSILHKAPQYWVLTSAISISAFCLALGLATRLISLTTLLILSSVIIHVPASDAEQVEYIFWLMMLSLLFFSGAGWISLDALVLRYLRRYLPNWLTQPKEDLCDHQNLPHVVVVGAGFGGMTLCHQLRHGSCRITLIDKHNYHLFQPLLYQVATASLSPSDIAVPIRSCFRDQRNIRVLLGEVVGVKSTDSEVTLADGRCLSYDYLVLATGARHSYFGKDEWSAFAPGMKTIPDALSVRSRVLHAFESAENSEDPQQQERLLTFVIIGGGPTGVELAGSLAELAHVGMQHEFRRINPAKARIYLIEAGSQLLSVMPESLGRYTQDALKELGVEVMIGARVESIDDEGVWIKGQCIATNHIFWAAGVEASPAAHWLGVAADRAGRIEVTPDLRVPDHDFIYAIGDTAAAPCWGKEKRIVPGLAPAAKQAGIFVAQHILARIEGRITKKSFSYLHYGSLATIGRRAAVADFGRFSLRGALAWWFWGAIHVMFLANMRNRVAVMIEWFWSYLTFRRSTRLITNDISKE
jgi:putative oxidoreductase